ncbi:hypothetical protein TNIN_370801 [Trichonephila inaurata madagascariensis]|uniref:Uncharacterized protein n=1 Tax=Trichonephila inaurata madagascariensis TaxID=2747483 RepID=A0A8X6MHJ8_9ARAC|nr:hypothetical protein TNIN_370801 [Trichonephila inaurata madagascariensis]
MVLLGFQLLRFTPITHTSNPIANKYAFAISDGSSNDTAVDSTIRAWDTSSMLIFDLTIFISAEILLSMRYFIFEIFLHLTVGDFELRSSEADDTLQHHANRRYHRFDSSLGTREKQL